MTIKLVFNVIIPSHHRLVLPSMIEQVAFDEALEQ